MKQSISAAAVVAACLFAFFLSAKTVVLNRPLSQAVSGWQTYCAVPLDASSNLKSPNEFHLTPIGRASPEIRSGGLFISNGNLRVRDVANGTQFAIDDGGYYSVPPVDCPDFEAYGWTVKYGGDGQLSACAQGDCRSISVMPRTLAFSIAAANGSIFVGTSQGDTLLFRKGMWCRMVRTGDTYACGSRPIPIVTEPSNQFYSSTIYREKTFIGEYPSGRIFEFDGMKVFPTDLLPPQIASQPNPGFESQTLASYCGSLFVGYWPYGEIFRFDGEKWHEPIRLFSSPPSPSPFKTAAEDAGVIFNFFGQRVASLVPYDGSLYAITSNKGDWNTAITPNIPIAAQEEYGSVYRIHGTECRTPAL